MHHFWFLLATLTLCLSSFSQHQDPLREARKLRAEAAYLEMKGEIEDAIKSYEASLIHLPDEKISAKVVELRRSLNSEETEPINEIILSEDSPEDAFQGEEDSEDGEGPTLTDEAMLNLIKALELPEDLLSTKPWDELRTLFRSAFSATTKDNEAMSLYYDFKERLGHPFFRGDTVGIEILNESILERVPEVTESIEMYASTHSDIISSVDDYSFEDRDWERVVASQIAKIEAAKTEDEEAFLLGFSNSLLVELVRIYLAIGNFDLAGATIDKIEDLDPETRRDGTYQAGFIRRHLSVIQEQVAQADFENPLTWSSVELQAAHLNRLRSLYFRYNAQGGYPDSWKWSYESYERAETISRYFDREIMENAALGILHKEACERVLVDFEFPVEDRDNKMIRFLRTYWYSDSAPSVRNSYIKFLKDSGNFKLAASLREFLTWSDIERIESEQDEHDWAFKVAEAWENAENWILAQKWYQTARKLNRSEEVEAALQRIKPFLQAEDPALQMDLSPEEQEILAQEIFERLSGLDKYDVDDFEEGYLEIIERCPNAPSVELAYLRISNLYREAWESPRNDRLIPLLEQYLEMYPDSYAEADIIDKLRLCLEEVGDYERLIELEATYYLQELAEDPQNETILLYLRHAEHLALAEQPDAAARWFKRALVSLPEGTNQQMSKDTMLAMNSQDMSLVMGVHMGLTELGYQSLEAIETILPAEGYRK